MFRFQTGSIKRDAFQVDFFETDACFDSKLVRLKVEPISLNKKGETEAFRFQTGSIKSIRVISFKPYTRWFRFQTGSIKSGSRYSDLHPAIVFRFQTGSIKRYFEKSTPSLVHSAYVSIPNWFD